MKSNQWLKLTSLCLILTVVASCGGKNSSGGSSQFNALNGGSGALAPNFRDTYMGTEITDIYNDALEWRNKSTETGDVISSGFTRGQIAGTGSTNNNCTSGTFLRFFNYNYCRNNSTTSSTINFVSTPTQFCTLRGDDNKILVASQKSDTIPYNTWGCKLTGLKTYNKGDNAELNKVLSLNNGNWHLYGAQRSGSVIYLLVGEKNVGPGLLYSIDTQYHSVYNPVGIQNINSGETVKTLMLQ